MIRVAGIDGGGTRTRCLVADQTGAVLGRGEAGPANCATSALSEVAGAIDDALRTATHAAGCTPRCLAAVCVGLAGFYPPWHAEALARALADLDLDAGRLTLLPDLVVAWAGGTALAPGVVLVAGTGSVAYGRNAAGREARAGGWGHLAGDEGSAYWMGREALAAVARTLDGREEATALLDLLPSHHPDECTSPEAWLRRVYREHWSPARVAALAPIVVEAAEKADPAARRIVERAAEELAQLVTTVLRKLELERAEVPVVAAGGILERPGPVRDAVQARLGRRAPQARLREACLPPVAGAVLLALRSCGTRVTEACVERLRAG